MVRESRPEGSSLEKAATYQAFLIHISTSIPMTTGLIASSGLSRRSKRGGLFSADNASGGGCKRRSLGGFPPMFIRAGSIPFSLLNCIAFFSQVKQRRTGENHSSL